MGGMRVWVSSFRAFCGVSGWDIYPGTIVRKLRHVFVVVELGVGNLMDGGAYRLHLTHTGADGDALRLNAEKAVRIPRNGLYLHRNGRSTAQRLHENLILLHIAAQIGGKLGQGLSRSL